MLPTWNQCKKLLPSKVKGPPVSVAFKDGKETRALQGFLQKCDTDQYEIETIQNQQYVFCTMQPSCKTVQQVLVEDFPTWLQKFPFKTQMKCTGYQFVRPSALDLLHGWRRRGSSCAVFGAK